MQFLIILAAIAALGCAPLRANQPEAEAPMVIGGRGILLVGVMQAQGLITRGTPVIDVREPEEFEEGHISGARNLPLGELPRWAPTLDKTVAYVVVCRSGKRSLRAAEALESMGFRTLYDVEGGMLEWAAAGYPIWKP